jgi:hypothetical protein
MKKSNKFLNGFIAFVIITSSLVIALFLNVPGQIGKCYKESFQPVQNGEQAENKIADWKTYRNEKYGFEFEYPDTLFLAKQEKGILILSSFSTTDIEASPVSDLVISIEEIKTSSYEDAQSHIKNLPTYLEGVGPYEKNINETLVYINTIKLYGGGEGVSKSYYFPKFVLVFAYANNGAENKFKDSEEKILSTLKFTEKDETADWKTYRNEKYGISFQYPSSWLLEKDSADKNIFGMSFAVKNINTRLSVIGVTNDYADEGPPGWFGYCAVSYKNVDQFCEKGCTRINDRTATRRGIENHGDKTYSLLAYTNESKKFPSICWELDLSLILSKIAEQKGINYYEVKNEDVEIYIKENNTDEDLKDVIQEFEEFSQSIKSF